MQRKGQGRVCRQIEEGNTPVNDEISKHSGTWLVPTAPLNNEVLATVSVSKIERSLGVTYTGMHNMLPCEHDEMAPSLHWGAR
ncbi:hypothetical protein U0070_015293 [Myodes glareolus]|uniref:Uncharacterized protein n=1 Tax=Myodes glareolus TaxID=447135 RepID=A0AAW0K1G6_MYOGA